MPDFGTQKGPFFLDVVPDGLVVGGLGIGQGGLWTGSYKGFAFVCKGISHILLLMGKFRRGDTEPKGSRNWPGPENPKNAPKGPRSPPGPPKSFRTSFLGPLGPWGPLRAHGAPGALV